MIENFFETWGLVISILALAAVLGGGLVSFGRFQGKIGEKSRKNGEDIEKLWDYQRDQDTHCQVTTNGFSTLMARVEALLESLQKNSDEVRVDVKELLKGDRK